MSFAKCSAEDRAKQLEREIWKLVDEGKLLVGHHGYGAINRSGQCFACAIGSAARAVCGIEEVFVPFGGGKMSLGPGRIAEVLKARGVATHAETMLMEAGFEGRGDSLDEGRWAHRNGVALDPDNPFFQLGQRLHRRERP